MSSTHLSEGFKKLQRGTGGVMSGGKPIIYKSEMMKRVMKMVDRVAPTRASILVLGESGTGKELLAQTIHSKSTRKEQAFVAINCGAIPENLLESELFGHEKGAFTGAYARKMGLAEIASGGTLFLDEIGDLSLPMQAKLLRFIQEGELYRLGGKEAIKVDVRLICATHRDLEEEVSKKNFREDLYYRINTISIHSPPLRGRREDIPLLAKHFLSQNSHGQGTQMTDEAMSVFMRYEWPGNIRELQNLCERLKILADGEMISLKDFPPELLKADHPLSATPFDPSVSLQDVEKSYIIKALKHFQGNKNPLGSSPGDHH